MGGLLIPVCVFEAERLQAFATPHERQTSKYRGKNQAWSWVNLLGLLPRAQWWQITVAGGPALELKTGTGLTRQ